MTEAPFITRRRPEGVEIRPMGWWGTVLLAMVLATIYGAMYFAYVYVRVASFEWPPPGIDPPELGRAGLSAVIVAASVVPVWLAGRFELARSLAAYRVAIVAAVGLAAAHLWMLVLDWMQAPFAVDTHAYASLFFVLPGFHLTILGLGVIMALVLLTLSWHLEAAALLHIGTRCLALYWYVSVVGGVLLLGVVYLIPHVWRVALPG